ncbi:MAG TPA: HEAT repeat domain-containing protein [Planctomycetota bacterium]|nr:HEAT repeat domain-containing protein [Planctomycetota bacterium]
MIAKALLAAPLEVSDRVFDWLLLDPANRLRVGGYDDGPWDHARALVERFSPACSDATYRRLEAFLLAYHHPHELDDCRFRHGRPPRERASVRTRYGEAQFALLSVLPRNRLSETALARLGVLQEKFRTIADKLLAPREGVELSRVTSPIPRNRLERLSDGAWTRLITGFTTPVETAPHFRKRGRAIETSVSQFAADLREVTRRHPDRFARLAARLPTGIHPEYAGAILEGLDQNAPPEGLSESQRKEWKPASAHLVCEAALRLMGTPYDDADRAVCRLVRRFPTAAWPASVIDRVKSCAMSHPDPEAGKQPIRMTPRDDDGVHEIETHAINCVRGVAAAALGALLHAQPVHLPRVEPALRNLVDDPHPAVRIAAVDATAAVFASDHARALELFLRCIAHDDNRVVCSHAANNVLNYIRRDHADRLTPIFERMRASKVQTVAERGAAHTTAAWLETQLFEKDVHACLSGHPALRRGVAAVAARWVAHAEHRDQCLRILTSLLGDADETVRAAVSAVFHVDGILSLPGCAQFAAQYVGSACFRGAPMWLLHAIERHRGPLLPLADLVLDACSVFCTDLAQASRDYSTSIAADAHSVPTLLLRLLEEAQESPSNERTVGRCLDALDNMLEARVGWASDALEKLHT